MPRRSRADEGEDQPDVVPADVRSEKRESIAVSSRGRDGREETLAPSVSAGDVTMIAPVGPSIAGDTAPLPSKLTAE